MTTAAAWDAAVAVGSYARSTGGASLAEVGFIHLSDAAQLPRVAAFLYSQGRDPLVVLELESDDVLATGAKLVWEDGGTGEEFPHLYAAIEPSWVIGVWRAGFDAAGIFRWPLP